MKRKAKPARKPKGRAASKVALSLAHSLIDGAGKGWNPIAIIACQQDGNFIVLRTLIPDNETLQGFIRQYFKEQVNIWEEEKAIPPSADEDVPF